eukprot:gene503-2452_t
MGDTRCMSAATEPAVPPRGPDPVSRKELWAWYLYDWANAGYSSVAISVFIPLVLELSARVHATANSADPVPPACSVVNDLANATDIPGCDEWGANSTAGLGCTTCMTCLPGQSDRVFTLNGTIGGYTEAAPELFVHIGAVPVRTASYALITIGFSVIVQFFVFVSFGAMADYGKWRKRMLVASALLGILFTLLFAAVPTDPNQDFWWIGGLLAVLSNVIYGLSIVFYNGYLPADVERTTTGRDPPTAQGTGGDAATSPPAVPPVNQAHYRAHPLPSSPAPAQGHGGTGPLVPPRDPSGPGRGRPGDCVTTLSDDGDDGAVEALGGGGSTGTGRESSVYDRVQNTISSHGLIVSYAGSVMCLVLCAAVLFAAGTLQSTDNVLTITGYKWVIFMSGMWWLFFSIPTFLFLKPRQGDTEDLSFCSAFATGWRQLFATLKKLRQYRQTAVFLALFFVYSDGASTIVSIGILYSQIDLCLPVWQQFLMALEVFVGAFFGGFFWLAVHRLLRVNNKNMVVINLLALAIIPAWGLLGYVTDVVGFKQPFEVHLLALWFGFNLVSFSAFSRTTLAVLTPPGCECEFFSFFEVADKGSSWIGPLVVAGINQAFGELRGAWFYILFMNTVPGAVHCPVADSADLGMPIHSQLLLSCHSLSSLRSSSSLISSLIHSAFILLFCVDLEKGRRDVLGAEGLGFDNHIRIYSSGDGLGVERQPSAGRVSPAPSDPIVIRSSSGSSPPATDEP